MLVSTGALNDGWSLPVPLSDCLSPLVLLSDRWSLLVLLSDGWSLLGALDRWLVYNDAPKWWL